MLVTLSLNKYERAQECHDCNYRDTCELMFHSLVYLFDKLRHKVLLGYFEVYLTEPPELFTIDIDLNGHIGYVGRDHRQR
jgi:hypothetical protein